MNGIFLLNNKSNKNSIVKIFKKIIDNEIRIKPMYVSPLNAKYNIIISPIKNIIKVTRNGNVKQAIKNLTKTIKILENKLINE
ncbi:unknown [Mycoplasma sp. CAG:472]|nr:unknown [Mycoplasma sp. CAG:472]